MTIALLLREATERLSQDPLARLEAEILLCHTLEVKRSFLFANPEFEISLKRRNEFQRLVRLRSQGEPIAYLVGKQAFWTLDLKVTPSVLIPRPETELLVEWILELTPSDKPWRLADLGTGSGAVALAVASERPACEVHATDISHEALEVARENARNHHLERVQFHLGSWLQALSGPFNLLASNPPYVPKGDPHMHQGDCRYEPEIALSPGVDGFAAIRAIVGSAKSVLTGDGWLLLEHGYDQGAQVRELLEDGGYREVSTKKDLAGLERVSGGRCPLLRD
jgi:release factor glutamine methyltransferase